MKLSSRPKIRKKKQKKTKLLITKHILILNLKNLSICSSNYILLKSISSHDYYFFFHIVFCFEITVIYTKKILKKRISLDCAFSFIIASSLFYSTYVFYYI